MRVLKKITRLKKMSKGDNSFVKATPQDRVACMWDITAEIWALKNRRNVKQRLQRHLTSIIKK